MEELLYNKPTTYNSKKVTVGQAVKILNRNGIQVTEDQAGLILSFLYLLAKGYKEKEPKETRTIKSLFR